MGTPDYMAPEQVKGLRGDVRTDIYSLGAILYEMLTGEVAFSGDNVYAAMRSKLREDPTPPRRHAACAREFLRLSKKSSCTPWSVTRATRLLPVNTAVLTKQAVSRLMATQCVKSGSQKIGGIGIAAEPEVKHHASGLAGDGRVLPWLKSI